MSAKQKILALLYVSGTEGVALKNLLEALKLDKKIALQLLEELKIELEESSLSPVSLHKYNQHYQLVTKESLEEVVRDYARTPMNQKLSRAAIETLAIIAYKQPITRVQIDEVRGVSSANMIQNLLARDLIHSVGRLESPGRPVLYEVTDYFMNYFALDSLEDLPEIEPIDLNLQAEDEQLFDFRSVITRNEEKSE